MTEKARIKRSNGLWVCLYGRPNGTPRERTLFWQASLFCAVQNKDNRVTSTLCRLLTSSLADYG